MKRWQMSGLVLAWGISAACSSGGSGANDTPATPSLTVSPAEWSVPAGGAPKQFIATLTGASAAITWSIETAGTTAEVGTISATGLYTPPASLATGRDVVVKATAGTLVARATVHVGAGVGGVTLAVTPPTASVVAGSGSTVVLEAQTDSSETVGWSMAPALGTLDPVTGASVVYTAPSSFVMWDTDVIVTATADALSDAATITVRPTALTVTGPSTVRSGGAAVEFTLATDVEGNAVAWSLDPVGVGSINGTGEVSTFTPVASVGSSTPFQVVATVGGATGRASATLLPPATPVTIAGRVVSHEGKPYAGAKVVIGAQSATSGADGAFSIGSVVPPYDVTLIVQNATRTDLKVTVFRGVSETTPVLDFVHFDPYQTATVSGSVTYDDGTGPRGAQGATVFLPFNSTTVFDPEGVYTFRGFWFGAPSQTLRYRSWAHEWDQATLRPKAYWYGARDVAVTAGGTFTGQDIALTKLTSGLVAWSFDYEDAYWGGASDGFSIGAHFSDGSWRALFSEDLSTAFDKGLQYVVPSIPDAIVRLGVTMGGGDGPSGAASAPVVPGQNGVALVLPLVPAPSAPAGGATGGYATTFTWTRAGTGGTDGVSISCEMGTSWKILGGEKSATIPNLAAHGISPGVRACTWTPVWESETIDEHVQGPAAALARPSRSASGVPRSFTFNP